MNWSCTRPALRLVRRVAVSAGIACLGVPYGALRHYHCQDVPHGALVQCAHSCEDGFMPIDHTAAAPLKDQLLAELTGRLAAGEFAVGQKFPSLRALADEYGVAEGTIAPAVQELQRSGLIAPSAGKGNFVIALPDPSAPTATGLPEEVRLLREEVRSLAQRVAALEAGDSASISS